MTMHLPDSPNPTRELATLHGVVLFDGVCNTCNAYVNYVIDHDPEGYFRFASLQSRAGVALAQAHGVDARELSTVVLIQGGKAYLRSDAVLRVCGRLRGPLRVLGLGLVVPAPVRDVFYRLFAANRYRLFGKRDACRVPTDADRARFIPDPPPGG